MQTHAVNGRSTGLRDSRYL